ncbi:MAG TPA: 3-deoxy-D-manno-octulosonic acid transferase [Tepidisphaeraceae bacterium]
MINGYDIAYATGLVAAAPFWLIKPSARRKVLKALRERMGHEPAPPAGEGPGVMIHAVALGEINATPAMVRMLGEARPDLRFVVSTTTETGYARGRELYGSNPRVTLIHYPLDFTPAIARVLDTSRPVVVVLMELEVWPNFMLQCERRRIPVVLVNGRLTPGSFRNYRMGGPLVKRMFRRLSAVCAQEQAYADRFVALGAPPERVRITGTMKFDTAQIAERIDGAEDLAAAVGLRPGHEPILVCGSTGPGEEEILLNLYRQLLERHPRLRLVLVPRKPERFDEVAELILESGADLVRRSRTLNPEFKSQISNLKSQMPLVVLGDTMGELRKFYSLADVVFVGRTLVDLGSRQHGSDMIEPAALAKPTVVGHYTGNFAEVMNQFRAADAMREVATPDELRVAIEVLLSDRDDAAAMGNRAQDVVRREQGATGRNVEIILRYLASHAV